MNSRCGGRWREGCEGFTVHPLSAQIKWSVTAILTVVRNHQNDCTGGCESYTQPSHFRRGDYRFEEII